MKCRHDDIGAELANGRVFSYMRWSSEPQSWGDSERRQLQAAEQWCARHGTVLADEKFVDRGVSARLGKNRAGDLGRLLSTVKRGDTLLVEDNDRLSRQDWLTAMNFLHEIVAKGVTVVTLANGNEITETRFKSNPGVFLPAILKAYLGNDENDKRRYRVQQAMDARRAKITTGEVTFGRLPAWLKWSAPRKTPDRKPIVIEAKAVIVRRIFSMCLEGKCVQAIIEALRGVTPIGHSKRAAWNKSSIHRLLNDKAVLGFHVPSDTPNVFPAIIEADVFHAAGAKLAERRNYSDTVAIKHQNSSLFTGLAFCSKCGHPLRKQSCRANGKTYYYLVCGGHLTHKSKCEFASVNYREFENTFLGLLIMDAEVYKALTAEAPTPSQLGMLKSKLAEVHAQQEKYMRLIDGDPNPSKTLSDRLKQADAQEAELTAQVEAEIAKSKSATPPVEAYRKLRAALPVPTLEITDRARLRELLRGVVERIEVKLGEDEYAVNFKGGKAPIGVKVFCSNVRP